MVWNGCTVDVAAGRRVLARHDRHVLADDDARLLVVEREQRGRGQDVGARVLLERAREEREVRDRADAGDRDRAVEDAGVEALPQRAQVERPEMMLLPLSRCGRSWCRRSPARSSC